MLTKRWTVLARRIQQRLRYLSVIRCGEFRALAREARGRASVLHAADRRGVSLK
jgi:hypothetical protein